jgi:hypothetical protein
VTIPSRTLLGLAGATLLLGCYTYVPATLDAVPVGTEVQALLSTEAEGVLHDSLGLTFRPLRGTVVDREQRRVLIAVRTSSGSPAFGSQPMYQRIGVAPQDILRVDVRRLHRSKTGALVVTVALAATLATLGALGKLSPGGRNGGGGGPAEQVVGW